MTHQPNSDQVIRAKQASLVGKRVIITEFSLHPVGYTLLAWANGWLLLRCGTGPEILLNEKSVRVLELDPNPNERKPE
jgi:hypothetical protein